MSHIYASNQYRYGVKSKFFSQRIRDSERLVKVLGSIQSRLRVLKTGTHQRTAVGIISLRRGNRVIRLSSEHRLYARDVASNFDFYFSSVIPTRVGRYEIVDFSMSRPHWLVGFDDFPVEMPSISEPLVTTDEYLKFAELEPGHTVFDLGAYSGVTSIMFSKRVGLSGRVIAVEADFRNSEIVSRNLRLHKAFNGLSVDLVNAAIWPTSGQIAFSAEGSMGSAVSNVIGFGRGDANEVNSISLDELAAQTAISRLDFIKCDIEGAEKDIFEDCSVIEEFRPRIAIETHVVNNSMTTAKVCDDLSRIGYSIDIVTQPGVDLPLLFCSP